MMFEALLKQVIVFSMESFGVWVPLAFGLAVGLAFAVISGAQTSFLDDLELIFLFLYFIVFPAGPLYPPCIDLIFTYF